MADEPTKQPHGIGWYAAWIVLVMVLYVASYGPATYLAFRFGGQHRRTILSPYRPLHVLQWTPAGMLLFRYTRWWAELAGFAPPVPQIPAPPP